MTKLLKTKPLMQIGYYFVDMWATLYWYQWCSVIRSDASSRQNGYLCCLYYRGAFYGHL